MNKSDRAFFKRVEKIKGPATKPPMLGTQRMRKEARKRTATWIEGDKWKVTGGDADHIVTSGLYTNPKTFICDCGGNHDSPSGVCCHILAVLWEM